MRKTIIPLAAVEKIIKQTQIPRVSEPAKLKLCEYLQQQGTRVAELAKMVAENSNRKTVNLGDILIGIQGLK